MITEQEAQKSVIALMTAMLDNDKQAREIVYSDMDEDSLKRIIRWAIRQNINHFATLCVMMNQDPIESWKEFAMMATVVIDENNNE